MPNVTKNKLIFQVSRYLIERQSVASSQPSDGNFNNLFTYFQVKTDLDIVSGPSAVTVLPSKTAKHVITVSPWKRGTFKGIVSFISSGKYSGSLDTAR